MAKLITRLESDTGDTLASWLRSIPKYPKAFKVKMRPIDELLDFNVRSLFVGELANETCIKSPTRQCIHGSSIEEFQRSFDQRRKSLELAIEMFRHKVSKFGLNVCQSIITQICQLLHLKQNQESK